MSDTNLQIDSGKFLQDMYDDDYFPNFLVDKVRDVIIDCCKEIESQKPASLEELYKITCRATDKINGLQQEFEDNDSEIETGAREDIAETFGFVADSYGFTDADLEELIATRDW